MDEETRESICEALLSAVADLEPNVSAGVLSWSVKKALSLLETSLRNAGLEPVDIEEAMTDVQKSLMDLERKSKSKSLA